MKSSIATALFNSFSYEEYKDLITQLLSEGKSTGAIQSENLLHYSTLNQSRLKRLDKTIVISPECSLVLNGLEKEYIWVVISEGWCGDAAQILPIINKMANESEKIKLRIILRDANEDVMNDFLTNGAKSIPKLLIVDKETGKVVDHWGPRPKGAVDLIQQYREQFGVIDDEAKAQLQLWYLHDKGLSVQDEITTKMCDLEECFSKRNLCL
ncbi:thioredoxin family protein [Flavobacterium adhaerens]|uniref:thioredoxin family protein n=1 Tax=Flavobacterium adhaerens TaxID=3149043 RepID=UPI0032B3DADB